jgi:hypothetical protein
MPKTFAGRQLTLWKRAGTYDFSSVLPWAKTVAGIVKTSVRFGRERLVFDEALLGAWRRSRRAVAEMQRKLAALERCVERLRRGRSVCGPRYAQGRGVQELAAVYRR